ncbi:hypothetical protein PLEOSDRAFT_1100837 [Pleurotus ostreatus PC15]|uniref:Uncharacterized protein n=1 Tax=Pleurotus ostreatus (strain PC15) TaxID=1137138 RepID=A0A067NWD4_PLEO1|nr:hypothetical protein PLEOSDRAFT_1100837 [Pleurotus ostreatus PC15]
MPREPVISNISNQELETRVAELKAQDNALYLPRQLRTNTRKLCSLTTRMQFSIVIAQHVDWLSQDAKKILNISKLMHGWPQQWIPTEAKQHQSYVDSLEASKLGYVRAHRYYAQGRSARTPGGTGHQRASQLRAVNNPHSRGDTSAWVIYAAHEQFHKGMEILKNLQSVNSSKTYLVEGKTGYSFSISESWNTVRPALCRARFLQGFLHGGFHGRPDVATEYAGHAIEIIKLGRKVWSNGRVAGPVSEGAGPEHQRMSFSDFRQDADSLITDIKESWLRFPNGGNDPEFIYSFHYYPLGTAYAFVKYVRVSGTFYLEASDQYPPDEEYSGWYLKCALANMMEIRSPLSLLVWAKTMKGGRDKRIAELLKTEKKPKELAKKNVVSMNDTFNESLW